MARQAVDGIRPHEGRRRAGFNRSRMEMPAEIGETGQQHGARRSVIPRGLHVNQRFKALLIKRGAFFRKFLQALGIGEGA